MRSYSASSKLPTFTFVRRFIIWLITALLLFANNGHMLYAHTCLRTAHTDISLYKPAGGCCKNQKQKSCCDHSKRPGTSFAKSDCCVEVEQYIKNTTENREETNQEKLTDNNGEAKYHTPSYVVTPDVTKLVFHTFSPLKSVHSQLYLLNSEFRL